MPKAFMQKALNFSLGMPDTRSNGQGTSCMVERCKQRSHTHCAIMHMHRSKSECDVRSISEAWSAHELPASAFAASHGGRHNAAIKTGVYARTNTST